MAEYIEKEKILTMTTSYKSELGRLRAEPFVKCGIETVEGFINELPTADVIERSKIDKAIEDINTEMSYGSARFMQETMYHKGLKRALEILKKNIGE
jgi:hypothetical protein